MVRAYDARMDWLVSCACWWPSRSSPAWLAATSRSPGTTIARSHLDQRAARGREPVRHDREDRSIAVLVFGLLAMVAGDLSVGSDNGWLAASLALYVALGLLVPIVFLPRGRVFDAALADARQRGEVTPALTEAFLDSAVSFARHAELIIVAVIIGLMVLKPFHVVPRWARFCSLTCSGGLVVADQSSLRHVRPESLAPDRDRGWHGSRDRSDATARVKADGSSPPSRELHLQQS
jgi:uncharacterized membrane protein